LLQKASAQNGVGPLNTSFTACSLRRSMRSMLRYDPAVVAVVAGSAAYSQVKMTSSAVNGWPSCHRTPGLSRQMTHVPSRATPPLSTLGTAVASTGTIVPSVAMSASGS
jgi:hypothetical protein